LESLLLVAIGGELAWLFATLATKALGSWAHIESSLAPDSTVAAVHAEHSGAGGAGLWPGASTDCARGGTGAGTEDLCRNIEYGSGKSRTGKVIVTLQMALCVVLLVGGGLLVRTLRNLQSIPLGFPADGLVVLA